MTGLLNKESGIMATRVVVRPHIPWYSYLFITIITVVIFCGLAWGMFEAGIRYAKPNFVASNTEQINTFDSGSCLKKGPEELCMQIAGLKRQSKMNHTINQDLTKRVNFLGEENDRLKEELIFFQHLISGNEKLDKDISIYHFNLAKEQSNNLYRYTISLVQGGQRPKNFQGNLKFSVTLRQNDQNKTVPLTNKNSSESFSVNFKFYHRMEETFQVPPNTTVEKLQVQVFKKNVVNAKLTQTIKLSQ